MPDDVAILRQGINESHRAPIDKAKIGKRAQVELVENLVKNLDGEDLERAGTCHRFVTTGGSGPCPKVREVIVQREVLDPPLCAREPLPSRRRRGRHCCSLWRAELNTKRREAAIQEHQQPIRGRAVRCRFLLGTHPGG